MNEVIKFLKNVWAATNYAGHLSFTLRQSIGTRSRASANKTPSGGFSTSASLDSLEGMVEQTADGDVPPRRSKSGC